MSTRQLGSYVGVCLLVFTAATFAQSGDLIPKPRNPPKPHAKPPKGAGPSCAGGPLVPGNGGDLEVTGA